MKSIETYVKLIAELASAGAVGATVVLGSALAAGSAGAAGIPADGAGVTDIRDRLAMIREASFVSGQVATAAEGEEGIQRAWGYRWFNGGGRGWRRGWNNWRPRWGNFAPRWNNFWRNW